MKGCLWLAALILFISEFTAQATVIFVGPNESYTSIKWAYNNISEGDTLIVRDGVYNENIQIDMSVTILSENMHGAVIGSAVGLKGSIRINGGTVTVDGFTFGPSGHNFGIMVGWVDSTTTVQNCIISNNDISNRSDGIRIMGNAFNTSVKGNRVKGSENFGIVYNGKGETKILGNRIDSCKAHGILISEMSDGTVLLQNDTIRSNGLSGITVESDNVTIQGCVIEGNGKEGIYANGGRNGIVIKSGNLIGNNGIHGIAMESRSHSTIEGNTLIGNIEHGILILGEAYSKISGNTIQKNGFNGIMLYGEAEISDNLISENFPNGIEVLGFGIITGNTISENLDIGIFCQGEEKRTWIENNQIIRNSGAGIFLFGKADVRGNKIEENRTGIDMQANGDTVYITGQNEIISSIENGIIITPGSSGVVLDNTISGNGTGVVDMEDFSGLFIDGEAKVYRNSIENNGGSGILIGLEAGNVDIRDNLGINGNREGIFMYSRAHIENNPVKNNQRQGIWIGELADSSVLKRNMLTGNKTGIAVRENAMGVSVFNCVIAENERGVASSGESVFRRNTIENNTAYGVRIAKPGIDLGKDKEGEGGYNMIRNNSPWNIRNLTSDTIYACYNFWEMADSIEIDSTIEDNDEDVLRGPVVFIPFLSGDPTGSKPKRLLSGPDNTNGISGVYPNPFEDELHINYSISAETRVKIDVLDLHGRIVARLSTQGQHSKGSYTVKWNGLTSGGKKAGSGIYFVVLEAGKQMSFRKVQLLSK